MSRFTTLLLASTTALLIGAACPTPPITPPLPACTAEDSVACHWDAQHQGNGLGRSFDVDAEGHVTYTDVPR